MIILNREARRGVAPSQTPLPPRLAIQTVIASEAKQAKYCFQRLLRHFMPRNDNQTASPKERGIKGVRLLHKDQRGFTLIEMAIAIAIVGIISSGIIMTIFGVISGNARSTNHMIAVRQVQNAGYWLSRDVQRAQSVVTGDEPTDTGFPLTLTWTDWDTGDVYQVIYTLEDNKLQRGYSVNELPSGTIFAAEFVDPNPAMTNVEFSSGDVLTLTITVTVGTGSPQEASETRTYEVIPRPSV